MAATKRHLTLDILNFYYAEVHNLQAYLQIIVKEESYKHTCGDGQSDFPLQAPDSVQYRELLTCSFVCLSKEFTTERGQFSASEPYIDMKDVIQKAQERLFGAPNSKFKPDNIITSGYKRALEVNAAPCGFTNTFVNTIITALQGPEWVNLLTRIGADAMLHLLTKTSIFVKLPNECLCQMTGMPLIYAMPPTLDWYMSSSEACVNDLGKRKRDPLEGSGPRKRLKLIIWKNLRRVPSKSGITKLDTIPSQRRTSADISFVRARMFYARPNREHASRNIIVGLPCTHVLNRLNPSYFRQTQPQAGAYQDPDPRQQAQKTRHLSKYIFPLQYGLSNVFSQPSAAKETYKQPNFADREREIELFGTCKTPKRLKDVLVLLEKMIWRHGKCGYKLLRDIACPSKLTTTDNKTMDSSIILEMVSENSIQLKSQASQHNMSMYSAGNSIVADRVLSKKEMEHKPRFLEFTCSHAEVCRYAILVTKAVIPKAFWGCERNFKVVQGYIKELIVCRRYETSTLHHVLQGFSTSECDWLIPPGEGARKQHRVSVTDSLKRRELLEEFLFWFYDSFLLPLLRTTFYVTESSAFRKHILYFRHDDWEILCAPLIDRLSEKTFQEIEKHEAEEILRQRQLGFSFIRLLPKETGVRPIVNLRRRTNPKGQSAKPILSINQTLRTTFAILTYEKQQQPDLLGASVFSSNEIYQKLKKFKTELLKDTPSGKLPKLYFVKVDVQACFDTIDQTMLLKILHNIISEENYMIRKHGQVAADFGKIKRSYIKAAESDDQSTDFVAYAREMAAFLRQTIFVDQVQYDFQSKMATLKLLEEHIRENLVKIGERYYRQVVGIPQGSVLSALLCSFFYGDLERTRLKIFDDPRSLLLRWIDDYLYVTTSLEKAKQFLDVMCEGHPEYGCIISKQKTLTNFEHDSIQAANITERNRKRFPWCGLLIKMSNLSVMADYSRYSGHDLEYSLTVDRKRRPGVTFTRKMLLIAKARSHMIYTDTQLNGLHTAYVNVYQSFIITALKMHHYIMGWGTNVAKNAKFLNNVIKQVIRYAHTAIRHKSCNKVARDSGGVCDLQGRSVSWLGTHAFYTVFSKKPDVYGASILLKSLQFELSLRRNKPLMYQFKKVVKEGLKGVTALDF